MALERAKRIISGWLASRPMQPEPPGNVAPAKPVPTKFKVANYTCEMHRRSGSELVVSLSHKNSFAFFKQPWQVSTLFVIDGSDTYYCEGAGCLVERIAGVVAQEGFDKVVLVGLSKGGTGALLLSALLAGKMPDVSFRAVSFSGQTCVYPENPKLPFPTYRKMIARSKVEDSLRRDLERYGNLAALNHSLPNLHWVLVYGQSCGMDVMEADRITAPNARKYPLPFGFHASSVPFCIDRQNEENIRKEIDIIYKNAPKEEDLMATLPSDKEEMVERIKAANWIPSFVDFVQDTVRMKIG